MEKHHDFSKLTIFDILEARHNYHEHLLHLKNVVGTAVGRYLIRKSDPDFKNPDNRRGQASSKLRTLSNSTIRDWSDPCVLVFVNYWPTLSELRKRPEEFVPPRLYLPDDRVVPTCVVFSEPQEFKTKVADDLIVSKDLLGGGFAVFSDVQGQIRAGSIGCLVTDGHTTFALTNSHVAGPAEQPSFMRFRDENHEIGKSAPLAVKSVRFAEVYPNWPIASLRLNLDAGLIAVRDVQRWTSQIYGIGAIGEPLNLHDRSIGLDLMNRSVRAFGGASGDVSGRIIGMFYRFRNRGGVDQVTDFLIGPEDGQKSIDTHQGDSGTLWGLDDENSDPSWRPFAMQWGGASFSGIDEGQRTSFVLASNLTTIVNHLGVDVVGDWNTGYSETWGKLGHFQVGAKACDLVSNTKLKHLMQENKELIGLSDDDRINRRFPLNKQSGFIALADVSDLWWKSYRGKEKPSHFADMDEEGLGDFAGMTLFSMFDDDPDTLNPELWLRFYESLNVKRKYQGSLPFRVKQFYEEMVKFVSNGDVAEFVAAAGILSHYLGDAAQPLHTSHLHHGHNEDEDGVHAQYETSMIDKFRFDVVQQINTRLDGQSVTSTFADSQNAAVKIIQLAVAAAKSIPPEEIIEVYNAARRTTNTNNHMWSVLGARTVDILAAASMSLAEIWESAWIEGRGDRIANAKLKTLKKTELKRLYRRKTFVESRWLEEMI